MTYLSGVYFIKTRLYSHDSRLTAYNLVHNRISYAMIFGSMTGFLMQMEPIDAVIVGADHATVNGDTVNKIGKLHINRPYLLNVIKFCFILLHQQHQWT